MRASVSTHIKWIAWLNRKSEITWVSTAVWMDQMCPGLNVNRFCH
jgi:hypothetical protein